MASGSHAFPLPAAFADSVCWSLASRPARAYSLLTHEQLIDLIWQSSVVPLLLSRYPTLIPARASHQRVPPDGRHLRNLLHRLAAHPDQPVPPGIRADILAYYADPTLPFAMKKKPEAWAAVQNDLRTPGSMPTSTNPDPFPTYDDPAQASPTSE